ncbi:MAG TPA: hypothetical protein DD676_06485, partial [Halomonas sp.]|nr:hypothetical protein [Halomonas sp.]
ENNTNSGDSSLIDPPTSNYAAGSPSQTAVDAFKDGGSEAFSGSYWTATENGSSGAWCVNFPNGSEPGYSKTYINSVRAVRRHYI